MSKQTESGREIFDQVTKKLKEVDMSIDYCITQKGLEERMKKAYEVMDQDRETEGNLKDIFQKKSGKRGL